MLTRETCKYVVRYDEGPRSRIEVITKLRFGGNYSVRRECSQTSQYDCGARDAFSCDQYSSLTLSDCDVTTFIVMQKISEL